MAKRRRNRAARQQSSRKNDVQQPEIENKQPSRVPRHELHHILRSQLEWRHRETIVRYSVRFQGPPRVSLDNISSMRMCGIESCCNKSMPIYILLNNWNVISHQHLDLLFVVLHNYLYNIWYASGACVVVPPSSPPLCPPVSLALTKPAKHPTHHRGSLRIRHRFRPYRSEIDWGQFIAQVIAIPFPPASLATESPDEVAHFAATLSRAICAHTEATQHKIGDRFHGATPLNEMLELAKEIGIYDWEMVHEQRYLVLQPLFRAVAVVLWGGGAYTVSALSSPISEMRVLLVLTGVEEGLSAPITLDSITDEIIAHHQTDDSVKVVETSLDTAVHFVMKLEERELAAFGPRPDLSEPYWGTRRTSLMSEEALSLLAQEHGWQGTDVPTGPSSSWVDTEIHREWTGEGARFDYVGARSWEEICRKRASGVERGENSYT
ncbi:hypothetical protein F5144DRAFT_332992 [Chaetomium tenue]|uniref:Uncharacterized protein n=1 Tax=Chaetomium tenue TaxID=1854479 RepID=A0ACB7NWA9_9PEZI|nr:hypothetical protein F5144DRAFT_332992 [Chaetomium globosum]